MADRAVGKLLKTSAHWLAGRGIESARLDAELLLAEVLELDRLHLYTSFECPMTTAELDAYRELILRRGEREPVAYILGRKEFWSRDFAADRRALIPRPDTEILVDVVLEALGAEPTGVVLDYGTGSGVIALTLAAERPGLRVLALDSSRDALDLARENAEALGLTDRVGFVHSDGLRRVPERFAGELLAIVSNPPYIALDAREGLAPEIREHEPEEALFPGRDALLHYRRMAAESTQWLVPGGLLAVEVGEGQAGPVRTLLRDGGWTDVSIRSDLARLDRVVSGRARAG